MSKEYIRNMNGKTIGWTTTEFPGQTAWSHEGKKLGTYSAGTNRTISPSGKAIAEGNNLSGLVWDHARSRGEC